MSKNSASSEASAAPSAHSFLKLPAPTALSLSDSFSQARYAGADGEKDEFYKNLHNVREKIQRLGTVREITDGSVKRLQRATDRYSQLLSERPVRDGSFSEQMSITTPDSVLNTSQGDLFNDEGVRSRLEAIQRKISQLENNLDQSSKVFVDKMTSAFGNVCFCSLACAASSLLDSNSRVSEVEKGRSMFISAQDGSGTSKDDEKIKSRGSSLPLSSSVDLNGLLKDRLPQRENPARGHDGLSGLSNAFDGMKADSGRHTPCSVSSTGSSLRPLSDSQRIKLHQFQDELRREVTGKTSGLDRQSREHPTSLTPSFKSGVQRRLEFAVDGLEQYCERCGLSKKSRCVCSAVEKRMREAALDSLAKDPSGFFSSSSGIEQTKVTKACGVQTNLYEPTKEASKANISCQVSNLCQPGFSAESSPARKISRKASAIEPRLPPFVAGKSTGPSHSVLVNWQQLLAVLKTQNPALHEYCLRLSLSGPVSAEFLEVFQREMNQLLGTWKEELRELSRDFSAAVQTTAVAGNKRKREIAKQANEIAAQMEAKDTAIQRIQRQLDAVIAAISEKHRRRLCKAAAAAPGKTSEQHRQRTGRAVSRPKTASACTTLGKVIARRRQTVALMRDAKALVKVING